MGADGRTDNTNPPFCLEEGVFRVLRALGWMWWPTLACLALAYGAHLVWWVSADAPWWPPAAGVAAAAAWAGVGWVTVRRRSPFPGGLPEVLRSVTRSLGVAHPAPWKAAAVTVLAAAALGAPWHPAAVVWPVLILLVLAYPRFGEHTVTVLELLTAGVGVGIVVAGLTAEDPMAWARWVAVAALTTGAVAVAAALVAAARRSARGLRAAVWLGPALVPPAVVWFGLDPLTWWTVGLFGWPAFLLLAAVLEHKIALRACQSLLAAYPLRGVIGKAPTGPVEEPVRDSNDHARVCFPEYRHVRPDAGEAGYATWVGGAADTEVLTEECVAFRTTSLAAAPFADAPDPRGRGLADLVVRLVPDLGLEQVEPLRRAVREAWTVRRLSKTEVPLVKMPWDHPYLLLVPVRRVADFRYPPGCGVHDVDEYPCAANKVMVVIRLRPALLDAVARLHDQPTGSGPRREADARLARLLLWNAWRILPAVYETLLTSLVERFRAVSVSLFERDGGDPAAAAVAAAAKQGLYAALSADLAARLPAPLGELVEATVTGLDVATYYAGDAMADRYRLRVQQTEQEFRLKRTQDRIWRTAEHHVLGIGNEGDTPELRLKLSSGLADARKAIATAVQEAGDQVAKMPEAASRADVYNEVQETLGRARKEFGEQIEAAFQDMQQTLNDVRAVLIVGKTVAEIGGETAVDQAAMFATGLPAAPAGAPDPAGPKGG